MVSVLLTRPQTTSAQLAKELQRQGYRTVIEPLLTITPVEAPRSSTAVQAIMITSANALTALEENGTTIDDLLGLPCFCVGTRTADRARAFGFRHVLDANGDGDDLAQLAGKTLGDKNKAILHIAGQDTASKAADGLQSLGLTVVSWPVYGALPATSLTALTIDRIKKQELDAVLLFSPRSAATLHDLLVRHALQACCGHLIAIGLSDAVTGKLQDLRWRRLIAAPRPTEDAVIACLKETLPVS